MRAYAGYIYGRQRCYCCGIITSHLQFWRFGHQAHVEMDVAFTMFCIHDSQRGLRGSKCRPSPSPGRISKMYYSRPHLSRDDVRSDPALGRHNCEVPRLAGRSSFGRFNCNKLVFRPATYCDTVQPCWSRSMRYCIQPVVKVRGPGGSATPCSDLSLLQ